MRRFERSSHAPRQNGASPAVTPATSKPVEILRGATLCRLQVWSDAEWAALPEAHRPAHFTRAPGLGWVGAVAVAVMN